MKIICEKCGKEFNTVNDCMKHEEEHVQQEKIRAERKTKELESANAIKKLEEQWQSAVKKHVEEYGKYPYTHSNTLPSIFDILFKEI
ncbi:MAG: hypothetical protein PHY39_07620 [Endomicrobiaceae bacterium]|nr:hypothetical protein [Endomicrobiaceae bacterium]